ncbi:MAG: hypothetical protein A2836_00935 [Candidatus Taylorbacteria bacterium RIFCSPHIGHO2_01_FULL_45_63]|uniref:Pyridoxamine 5'-phosphate oxidase N-terminal domain-containing protein n=1 Tax=Candidatus Taylorbacteria bacterium RIFCSPHIGHO2_02_FULL_45_35 TaxID=1802311 RepID=A0A1G2MUW4_9BACT|nr:MAG: hypothetical protein A2836_00935 [Candidatus Taylorbacteria bacterium RIFCSPHIGHO2_01_FULL_45_63]OHA27650.1 MAG: hypothetical protein A3D56_04170 [Candidatus Taylorbacteria bacterium RIFCSPHIGHO2_02_FULL_45_35]OHA34141.1 MAG: hypothetical protein A3A22_01620 [Candidatus Taylorbacteria bacterium RIFCSPLOWO2_01_FULL_45_34b]
MNPKILAFLEKERVCVLSGIIPKGGSHSSTVHYSHGVNPLRFFFQTWDESMKVEALQKGTDKRASVVVGFSEQDNLTLQMRGALRVVSSPEELEAVYKIHFKKHPFAEKYKNEHTVVIEFTPTWWRYTDFNTTPETIIDME